MKGVDTIARVRREFFQRRRTIKEIARDLHIARNTVRKIVRSGAMAFTYEREHQPLPKIGPWRNELGRLLLANEGKPAREKLTLIRIYEELCTLGYDGSYDAVRRYANPPQSQIGTPIHTAPRPKCKATSAGPHSSHSLRPASARDGRLLARVA